MSIEIASFVFGGILLFVGLLGGGFEVKELKIPKVGTGVRILAALLGVVFITVGIGSHADDSPKPVNNNDNNLVHAGPPPDVPVEFNLIDDLGQGEVSEQVTILIDGKDVGNLTVNQEYPHCKIRVTVPRAGQHSYTAEATTTFSSPQGQFGYNGAGQGMIDVQPGKTYSLRGSVTGNALFVSIEQDN